MVEIVWRFPMRCPQCDANDGRPCRVESRTAAEVIVFLRCGQCGHEWTVCRQTPLLIPTPPNRVPPEDQA